MWEREILKLGFGVPNADCRLPIVDCYCKPFFSFSISFPSISSLLRFPYSIQMLCRNEHSSFGQPLSSLSNGPFLRFIEGITAQAEIDEWRKPYKLKLKNGGAKNQKKFLNEIALTVMTMPPNTFPSIGTLVGNNEGPLRLRS
ncbi:hypothetical protein NE237_027131 [Protea cynaroides]|uniref:Uncharacterized protein n=1 Tax=Protea cynaroides TaxID=273540 RepID=A0A9Q0JRL8_9MAGN|nr:hypothetical protein NE237_027131 [Protea cynaroides]